MNNYLTVVFGIYLLASSHSSYAARKAFQYNPQENLDLHLFCQNRGFERFEKVFKKGTVPYVLCADFVESSGEQSPLLNEDFTGIGEYLADSVDHDPCSIRTLDPKAAPPPKKLGREFANLENEEFIVHYARDYTKRAGIPASEKISVGEKFSTGTAAAFPLSIGAQNFVVKFSSGSDCLEFRKMSQIQDSVFGHPECIPQLVSREILQASQFQQSDLDTLAKIAPRTARVLDYRKRGFKCIGLMERAPGQSVGSAADQNTPEKAASFWKETGASIGAMHALYALLDPQNVDKKLTDIQTFVHDDLYPENIFVDLSGNYTLIDVPQANVGKLRNDLTQMIIVRAEGLGRDLEEIWRMEMQSLGGSFPETPNIQRMILVLENLEKSKFLIKNDRLNRIHLDSGKYVENTQNEFMQKSQRLFHFAQGYVSSYPTGRQQEVKDFFQEMCRLVFQNKLFYQLSLDEEPLNSKLHETFLATMRKQYPEYARCLAGEF